MLSVQRLSLSLDAKELFSDISLTISKNARIGLVGFNGSGKSSFIKVLSGEITPSAGVVVRPKGFIVGIMPQFTPTELSKQIVFDAVKAGAKLPHEDYEIDTILYKLGFEYETIYSKKVSSLSGGWQKLVLFAIALVDQPDLLLLDEPTNHMDLKARAVFTNYLSKSLRIPYVLVSHDRDFLDKHTNQTLFLRDKTIHHFAMPFSASREELLKKDIAALEARKAEEKEIKRLENSAKRLAFWGKAFNNESAASAAKSMEKRIGHLQINKTYTTNETGAHLQIGTKDIKANRALKISSYDVISPGETLLFHIDELVISPGDRIVLLGTNGVGKSTFIHAIYAMYLKFAQNEAIGGSFSFNPRINIGLFDQSLSMTDPNTKVADLLEPLFGNLNLASLTLRKAGLASEFEYKKVGDLSGGEKARLQLIILEKSNHPFLLLDEPTSHLDIIGVEDLENNLVDNSATCLFTSHDRRFVENVANRFLLINDHQLTEVNSAEPFYAVTNGS